MCKKSVCIMCDDEFNDIETLKVVNMPEGENRVCLGCLKENGYEVSKINYVYFHCKNCGTLDRVAVSDL